MLRGNQHGGRRYDDLQNWLDMTSHENPLCRVRKLRIFYKRPRFKRKCYKVVYE